MSLGTIFFLILFQMGVSTFQQTAEAYSSHVKVEHTNVLNEVYRNYAESIAASIPESAPVVVFVPLNGVPNSEDHPSYRNSKVALEILKKLPNRDKYLLLSEGNDSTTCSSGAEIVAAMLYMHEGYNSNNDVTVLLEKDARTTLQNVILSEQILRETFQDKQVYVLVAGISDIKETPFGVIDIGHGARAFVLAKQRDTWSSSVHLEGIIPTNTIDFYIGGYPSQYNLATMILGANGLLHLPFFDRSEAIPERAGCAL